MSPHLRGEFEDGGAAGRQGRPNLPGCEPGQGAEESAALARSCRRCCCRCCCCCCGSCSSAFLKIIRSQNLPNRGESDWHGKRSARKGSAFATEATGAQGKGSALHAMSRGKFHGMICPTTPTGSCVVAKPGGPVSVRWRQPAGRLCMSLTPPHLPLVGVATGMERGCQRKWQNSRRRLVGDSYAVVGLIRSGERRVQRQRAESRG